MNIYIDGIFDLFHYGHIESFRKCKELFPDMNLIVGILSDKTSTYYKRKPIYNQKHRYALVKNLKYIDDIIENSPLVITKEFMEKYNIKYILHGFSDNYDEEKQNNFFSYPISINAFKKIKYCDEISTTNIINKILDIKRNN
tara:strand:- start:4018 stop:4443 length:426 start_codon:yes stop_codon:yes gene_type:complete